MDAKELVQLALRFERVPRVPYAVGFTVPALELLLASPTGRALHRQLANDLLLSPAIRVQFGERDATGHYTDEFGVVWDRRLDRDIGIPRAFVTPESLSRVPWPDPGEPGRFAALRRNIREHPGRFHVLSLDFSLYERAWALRGLENLYVDMIERPDFVGELLDRILAFNLQMIEAAFEACPEVDAVHFGDDFGGQTGIPMGVQRWRELLKPRLARQFAAVRSAGKWVSIHSCGKVEALFDDLVEIGVQLFNPFQPEVMDVEALLEGYRGRLAFWGGVSTQRLLPFGTAAQVEARVEELLAIGRRGGYVIAPAHDIPGDARVENVEALLRHVLQQGQSGPGRRPTTASCP